jgi:hypothetical protein
MTVLRAPGTTVNVLAAVVGFLVGSGAQLTHFRSVVNGLMFAMVFAFPLTGGLAYFVATIVTIGHDRSAEWMVVTQLSVFVPVMLAVQLVLRVARERRGPAT